MPDGSFGLRVDKVVHLQQHSINHKTVIPTEGQVTPLQTRPILKSTKKAEKEMDELEHHVRAHLAHLPWLSAQPNPLEVYRHSRLPDEHLLRLGWRHSQHPRTHDMNDGHSKLHGLERRNRL